MPHQDTTAANDAPMITARNVDGSGKPRQLTNRSAQAIAADDGASTGGLSGTKPVTAPLAAGDT